MRLSYCLLMVLSFSFLQSCRKCMVCANRCYKCQKSDKPMCNTAYTSDESFDALIVSAGGSTNCKLIEPTEAYKICDDPQSLQNLKRLNEYARYSCD